MKSLGPFEKELGGGSLQADCWVCEYEQRQRQPDGTSLGPWSAWKKRRGYVVVPEPNPFFIVEEVRHV